MLTILACYLLFLLRIARMIYTHSCTRSWAFEAKRNRQYSIIESTVLYHPLLCTYPSTADYIAIKPWTALPLPMVLPFLMIAWEADCSVRFLLGFFLEILCKCPYRQSSQPLCAFWMLLILQLLGLAGTSCSWTWSVVTGNVTHT